MTTPDPFALARSRDASFTLEQAARLVHDIPPYGQYPRRPADWTQELRDEWGLVQEALRALQAAATELGVTVTHRAAKQNWQHNGFTDRPYLASKEPARIDYGKVTREALMAWCEVKGLRPTALFPAETMAGDRAGASGVADMNANRALAVMALLLARRVKQFQLGTKPNASKIGEAVAEAAAELYGEDVKGLNAFRKRIAKALKEYPEG